MEEAQAVGAHCNIKASVWTGEGPNAVQANAYRTAGQLVVSTPGRIAQALENGLIQTSLLSRTLSMFVLDEADLLLLHEYEGDLQAIAPQVCLCLSGRQARIAFFACMCSSSYVVPASPLQCSVECAWHECMSLQCVNHLCAMRLRGCC